MGLLDLDYLGLIKYIESRLSSLGLVCFSKKCVLLDFCNMPHSKENAILLSQGLLVGGQKTMPPFTFCASYAPLQGSASHGAPPGSQPQEAEHGRVGRRDEERVSLLRETATRGK